MRLRYIFIVLFCIVALLPVAIFWTWPYSQALQHEIQGAEGRHLLLARNVSNVLSRYQRDAVNAYDLITNNLTKNIPITDYEEVLNDMSFRHICVFNYPEGSLAFEASKWRIKCPDHLPDKRRQQFEQLELSNQPQFTEVSEGPNSSPVMFLVSRKANYLAVGAISTEYFVSLARSITFGNKGHAAIVDHAGNVIAHPLQSWIDKRRNLGQLSIVQNMLRGESGITTFYSPALKAEMIAGYTRVPDVNWGVMVPQPLSELEDKVSSIKSVATSVVASGAVIAAFLAWLVSSYLSRPLERFTKAAQRVGAGDLSPDFDIGNQLIVPKEVNAARVALNNMTVQLRGNADAMNRLAFIDSLTSLPNRQHFRTLALAVVHDATGQEEPVTLLFCDLNGFKTINDTYGHRAGDEVLKEFAARLDHCVTRYDPRRFDESGDRLFVPGRLGGDEFAVCFRGLEPEQVVPIAEALLNDIKQPMELYHNEILTISASIGLAGSPHEGDSLNNLLRCADAAMYYAKRHASHEIAIYDPQVMKPDHPTSHAFLDEPAKVHA